MTTRPRPTHADPTLWEASMWDVVVPPGGRPPIAHRITTSFHNGFGSLRHRLACGVYPDVGGRDVVRSDYAAQFAVPCLRCWPDAKQGREATVAARAKATA